MGNDELLNELKGVTSLKTSMVDAPPVNDHTDRLETKPANPPTAVEKMDAQHSTRSGGKGYCVKVEGEYRAHAIGEGARGKKVIKKYSISANLPSLEGALSVLKNRLLPKLLPKKYPDYISLRTLNVTDTRPLNAETPESTHLQFMSRPNLVKYANDNHIPLNSQDPGYEDTVVLRAAIVDYTLNPKDFKVREAKRQQLILEDVELAKLNPDINKPSAEELPEEKDKPTHMLQARGRNTMDSLGVKISEPTQEDPLATS